MTEPEFDADGYPTEATEQALRDWPHTDAAGALRFMQAAWHWPERVGDVGITERLLLHATPDEDFVRFSTGGWSGNESLISALCDNRMVWVLTWRLSTRGGLHIFQWPST